MSHLVRSTWTFLGIWTFCCFVHHAISDVTVCSEYLVSGLNGVEDTVLTASSYFSSRHEPTCARLHLVGNDCASSWAPVHSNGQQYIQVQFRQETTVDAIMIQGRGDTLYQQWVTTYYVSYSIDGLTWTNVTSQNQDPKIFTGNTDTNTVVKSSLVPSITAVYIRIIPRSWYNYICLRFDVSGCYIVKGKNSRSEFYRLPMLPSADTDQHYVFESHSQSLPSCGKLCHMGEMCFSFTFDTKKNICRGYELSVVKTVMPFSTESTNYFVNAGLLTSLGFRILSDGGTFYKVNEIALNQTSAADVCIQQYSGLMRIKSKSEMLSLQNVIAGNTILAKHHHQLFVFGMYVLPDWRYTNETEVIGNVLWSPGNPDPGQGHCVMMTPTGLQSVECSTKLFSICEFF